MRRSALVLVAAGLIAVLLTPSATRAQVTGPVLSLEDAIQLARENNPTYLQSLNGLEQADVNVRYSFVQIFPTLSGNVGTSMSARRTTIGTDDFGSPIQRVSYRQSSSSSYGIRLNAVLFDGGQRLRNYWNAKDAQRSTEAQVARQEIAVAATVTSRYLAAARAQRLVDVARRNAQNGQARLNERNELYELAATTRASVLQSRQALNRSLQSLREAEARALQQRMGLWEYLGMEGEPSFAVDATLPPVFDPANLDAEALVARALTDNPQVRIQQASLAQSERNLTNARWTRYLPTISASFSYSTDVAAQDYSRFASVSDLNRGYALSLQASIPLFDAAYDHIQGSRDVVNARIGVENDQLGARQQQIELGSQVRQAVIDLQVAYDALTVAQNNARLAAEMLSLSDSEYRLGGLNYIEFQSVIDEEAQARRDVVDREFDFFTARTALEQLLGGPLNN